MTRKIFQFYYLTLILFINFNYSIHSSEVNSEEKKSFNLYGQRQLPLILKEINSELNEKNDNFKYDFNTYSHEWIIEINKSSKNPISALTDRTMRVFGYTFPINDASAVEICKDKPACSEILYQKKVPCIPHKLFINPSLEHYTEDKGIFTSLFEYASEIHYPLVVKVKDGSGGNDVFLAPNNRELEKAAITLFSKGRDICLSPYYDIIKEFRVIVLDGSIQIIFNKIRPCLIGNGKDSFLDLLTNFIKEKNYEIKPSELLNEKINFNKIIKDGETVHLNWKHNLGLGSIPEIISEEHEIYLTLRNLAVEASQAVGIHFGSVDIVQIKDFENTCNYKVLEINSGVMMENFIKFYKENNFGYKKAKEIYKKSIIEYFNRDIADLL